MAVFRSRGVQNHLAGVWWEWTEDVSTDFRINRGPLPQDSEYLARKRTSAGFGAGNAWREQRYLGGTINILSLRMVKAIIALPTAMFRHKGSSTFASDLAGVRPNRTTGT